VTAHRPSCHRLRGRGQFSRQETAHTRSGSTSGPHKSRHRCRVVAAQRAI